MFYEVIRSDKLIRFSDKLILYFIDFGVFKF